MQENSIELFSFFDILVKTSYHTQITKPNDKNLESPVGFGSGFIVEFNNSNFFVTADHTLHLDDYDEEKQERIETEYVISIFNNYNPPDNFPSTVFTPLGGFHYMDQINLDEPEILFKPVDVCVCKMQKTHFQYPFLTDEVRFTEDFVIKAGQEMYHIKTDSFAEPNTTDNYFAFGKIRTKIVDGIRIDRLSTIKPNLKFIAKVKDYFLFNTPNTITDSEDWSGLSGCPVLNEKGYCVGVFCSINENTNMVFVMPISKVKILIDIANNDK